MGTKSGTIYHPSTLVQLPAKGNKWYVVVTKPKELQTEGSIKVRRSTGTSDRRIARTVQTKLTQEIYAEFDAALTPKVPTLAELALEHWKPAEGSEFQTFDELVANSEGGSLFGAIKVWEASGHNPDVAESLFDSLDYHEAVLFRGMITPVSDPYPITSQKSQHYDAAKSPEGKLSATAKNFPIKALVDLYLSERQWGREKSKAAAERHLKLFIDIVQLNDVTKIKKVHAYRFAEGLQAKGYANKTIVSAVSSVRAFLTECEKKELIVQSPFSDLKLSNYGTAPVSYKPFTFKQLSLLFAQRMKPSDRLCLSILTATGMRLDEVCLLNYEQVRKHQDGFLYVDLTNAVVKNSNSQRYVPLHPAVKIDHNGKGRIFDYKIGKDNKAESDASKRLMRIIRKVSNDPQHVVHSLRGTFKDMLREAGATKEMNDFITGHSQGDTASAYGVGPSIRARYEAISLLDLTFLGQS
jgi:integrase